MQASLAYIDNATDAAVKERSEKPAAIPESKRIEIRRKATKSVAGFDVFDEQTERAELDALIAKNRESVDTFIGDRKAIREKLDKAGVSALAVVPLTSWRRICRDAGLFMLNPDSKGQVHISGMAFEGLPASSRNSLLAGMDKAEQFAQQDWTAWLKRLFPNNTDADSGGAMATLVLPVPPADVIDTLLKLNRAGVAMKTAAVAEAISFKESVPQLRRAETARREEEARRLEALRHDPIVYTEHGTVAAIVAQFGDFPIEKEVIDAVVAAADFIPEKPKATHLALFTDGSAEYYREVMRMMAAQQSQAFLPMPSLRPQGLAGLFGT